MDTVFYAVNLVGLRLIFEHTKVLAGWDFSQACLFLAMFLVVDGIFMTVFSANMWLLPIAINKGELDYYLLRPASSLFFLGLREFSSSSLINLACAIGILAWAIGQQADRVDHHPDLFIGYQYVEIGLNTHDVGGISTYDFMLAEIIEGLV
jgi:ABC-2 type transport system permease protein